MESGVGTETTRLTSARLKDEKTNIYFDITKSSTGNWIIRSVNKNYVSANGETKTLGSASTSKTNNEQFKFTLDKSKIDPTLVEVDYQIDQLLTREQAQNVYVYIENI
jgi:hypothetical protein